MPLHVGVGLTAAPRVWSLECWPFAVKIRAGDWLIATLEGVEVRC